jgi:hypothetical protein
MSGQLRRAGGARMERRVDNFCDRLLAGIDLAGPTTFKLFRKKF